MYMAIFTTLLIWLRNAHSRPFGGGLLGVWPLRCNRLLSRRPKRHILGRKHVFWRIDRADWSRNATWARVNARKKKEKKKKRNSEMWQVTWLPRPPTWRYPHYPHQSCHVGWGPRRTCLSSFIKIGSEVLAPRGGQHLPFSYTWHYGYITGLGYRPTSCVRPRCWCASAHAERMHPRSCTPLADSDERV